MGATPTPHGWGAMRRFFHYGGPALGKEQAQTSTPLARFFHIYRQPAPQTYRFVPATKYVMLAFVDL